MHHKGALCLIAGLTGLEPATFRVTGGRANQLRYSPNTHILLPNPLFLHRTSLVLE